MFWQRSETLLVEYKKLGRGNKMFDHRIGENDPAMSFDEKMAKRFALERQVRDISCIWWLLDFNFSIVRSQSGTAWVVLGSDVSWPWLCIPPSASPFPSAGHRFNVIWLLLCVHVKTLCLHCTCLNEYIATAWTISSSRVWKKYFVQQQLQFVLTDLQLEPNSVNFYDYFQITQQYMALV